MSRLLGEFRPLMGYKVSLRRNGEAIVPPIGGIGRYLLESLGKKVVFPKDILNATVKVFRGIEKTTSRKAIGVSSGSLLTVEESDFEQILRRIPTQNKAKGIKRMFTPCRAYASGIAKFWVSPKETRELPNGSEYPVGDGVSFMAESTFKELFPTVKPETFKISAWFGKGMVTVLSDSDYEAFASRFEGWDGSGWIGDQNFFKEHDLGSGSSETTYEILWGIHKLASEMISVKRLGFGRQGIRLQSGAIDSFLVAVLQELFRVGRLAKKALQGDLEAIEEIYNVSKESSLNVFSEVTLQALRGGMPVSFPPILDALRHRVGCMAERATRCMLKGVNAYALPSDVLGDIGDAVYVPRWDKPRATLRRNPITSTHSAWTVDCRPLSYFRKRGVTWADPNCFLLPSWMMKAMSGDFDGDTLGAFDPEDIENINTKSSVDIRDFPKGTGKTSFLYDISIDSVVKSLVGDIDSVARKQHISWLKECTLGRMSHEKRLSLAKEAVEDMTNILMKASKGPSGMTFPKISSMRIYLGKKSRLRPEEYAQKALNTTTYKAFGQNKWRLEDTFGDEKLNKLPRLVSALEKLFEGRESSSLRFGAQVYSPSPKAIKIAEDVAEEIRSQMQRLDGAPIDDTARDRLSAAKNRAISIGIDSEFEEWSRTEGVISAWTELLSEVQVAIISRGWNSLWPLSFADEICEGLAVDVARATMRKINRNRKDLVRIYSGSVLANPAMGVAGFMVYLNNEVHHRSAMTVGGVKERDMLQTAALAALKKAIAFAVESEWGEITIYSDSHQAVRDIAIPAAAAGKEITIKHLSGGKMTEVHRYLHKVAGKIGGEANAK